VDSGSQGQHQAAFPLPPPRRWMPMAWGRGRVLHHSSPISASLAPRDPVVIYKIVRSVPGWLHKDKWCPGLWPPKVKLLAPPQTLAPKAPGYFHAVVRKVGQRRRRDFLAQKHRSTFPQPWPVGSVCGAGWGVPAGAHFQLWAGNREAAGAGLGSATLSTWQGLEPPRETELQRG
jgi:hypothetical protein